VDRKTPSFRRIRWQKTAKMFETDRQTDRQTEREREREREREVLLTIKKGLTVGKHNALSGDTAPGCTGSSIDGEYSTPTLRLAVWHALAGG